MTYYQQLKPVFEQHVHYYKEDFTKHDRNTLRSIKVDFLWSCRECGTNIFMFDHNMTKEEIEWEETFYLGSNEHFCHCSDGKAVKISKDEAAGLIDYFKQSLNV